MKPCYNHPRSRSSSVPEFAGVALAAHLFLLKIRSSRSAYAQVAGSLSPELYLFSGTNS